MPTPKPEELVLNTIAKMVDADGMEGTNSYFNMDLLVHINTFLIDLYQVGIGERGYVITEETTWADYLKEDIGVLAPVKDYLYMQTKLVFDPPQSSAAQQALKETSERILYRLREQLECTETL
jgi:hypothetical protein